MISFLKEIVHCFRQVVSYTIADYCIYFLQAVSNAIHISIHNIIRLLNRLADHKPEIHNHSINSQRIVHCADQESPMKQGDNRTGPATAGTVKACQLMYFAGTSETKNP